jgi:hypothetical protein
MSNIVVNSRNRFNNNEGRMVRRCSTVERSPKRIAPTKLRAAEGSSARLFGVWFAHMMRRASSNPAKIVQVIYFVIRKTETSVCIESYQLRIQ